MSDNEGSDNESKKGKGGTKRKAKKGGPKRPLSAYMFYCQANRDQVKKDNPDIAFTEVAKVLGSKWNELSESEKKPFEKQHAADKARYEKEKAEHPDADDDGGGKKKKTKTAKKKKEGPKKPLTAFMCFSQEERKRMKDSGDKADFGETGKIIGAKWKQLSDSEKAPYNELAEKAKAHYDEQVKEWEKTHGPIPKKASKPKKKKKDDDDDGGDEEDD